MIGNKGENIGLTNDVFCILLLTTNDVFCILLSCHDNTLLCVTK